MRKRQPSFPTLRVRRFSRMIAKPGRFVIAAVFAAFWLCGPRAAQAQLIGLVDEIILISKGITAKASRRGASVLGQAPGAGENPFMTPQGGRGRPMAQRANPARSTASFRQPDRGVLSSISTPGPKLSRGVAPLASSQPQRPTLEAVPLFGPLEVPQGEIEGPPNGLTLEQAVERLVRENAGLRSKAFEIPQARADELTAGLRGNPLYFLSASNVPYSPYSAARPGNNDYSISVIQPLDLNHKRKARAQAAAQATRVLEAQYQDAVRMAIDDLYLTYLDVVVARETVYYAQTSLKGAEALMEKAEVQLQQGAVTEPDLLNVGIQRDAAQVGLEQARAQLLEAKHALAALLNIPSQAAAQLELRGSLHDSGPRPPGHDELVRMALFARPDLAAFRLGIQRARADARAAGKEWFEDVFVIYSPYQFQNNRPVGGLNATSYSFGVLGSIPLFDRRQGEVRRANLNVVQSRVALVDIERTVQADVERAAVEYEASRRAVERIEHAILPASRRVRDSVYRLYTSGEKSVIDYLNAQKDHNEIVRQYRDALIRHRRSMLRLNTAVGQRILP